MLSHCFCWKWEILFSLSLSSSHFLKFYFRSFFLRWRWSSNGNCDKREFHFLSSNQQKNTFPIFLVNFQFFHRISTTTWYDETTVGMEFFRKYFVTVLWFLNLFSLSELLTNMKNFPLFMILLYWKEKSKFPKSRIATNCNIS